MGEPRVARPQGGRRPSRSDPTTTFGYAPLNWRLRRQPPKVGGKFYRPAVDDPLSEDRMRFWISEKVDPTLSADFYVCRNLSTDVFVVIVGNTCPPVSTGGQVLPRPRWQQ